MEFIGFNCDEEHCQIVTVPTPSGSHAWENERLRQTQIKPSEVALYEFEAVYDIIPEEERLSLSRLFTHELMGEIALEWVELIRTAINGRHEVVVFKIHKENDFIGVAMISIVRRMECGKYLWKPTAPLLNLFAKFDMGFLEIPFSNLPGLLTVEGIDHVERSHILHALCSHIRELNLVDTLCVKVDNSVEHSNFSPWCKGMAPLSFYPNTLLEYPYKSFDEYQNTLTRKKWRRIRSDKRRLRRYGGSVEVCHNISPVVSTIYSLYKKTSYMVKKKPHYIEMPVTINQEFYSSLPLFSRLKPSFVLVKANDVIIAYSLLLQSGATLFFKAVGLDYDLSYKTKAYFNLYYAALQYASQQKCDKVDFGITGYQFKTWIGCKSYPATYFFDSSNPFISLFKKPIALFVESRIRTGRSKTA